MYRIHLTNAQGEDLGQMPLPGISEPALHPAANDFALAYRSWNDPTGPRALVASTFEADRPQAVTHFWEDAQPDWSPTENRLIFASQRESDRRWRLYTAWGDGSLEVNLRREGQSPTFAPDGYRFAYQGCANNQCGLWLADLEHSELETQLILANPQAKAPDWSPVGEDIAYMAESNGQWDLYLIGSDGRNLRRLTNNSANNGLPTWSPDGEWLAFVSDRGGQWGVWRLHVASGEAQPVVAFAGSLVPENRRPYNEHGERNWWDEQISWGQ
jgi:Tol biopolymer transport system component